MREIGSGPTSALKRLNKRAATAFLNRFLRRYDIALVRLSELWRASSQPGNQPLTSPGPQPAREPHLRVFGPDNGVASFDVSVVMPTILRPTIEDALRSIFAQDLSGYVQTLIGVDWPGGDVGLIDRLCWDRPPNHSIWVFDPGYSTSTRHGGLHPCWDGGVMRTVLSYLAGSRRVAYLDDDNWWAPNHLRALVAALEGHDWAWSLRWYVHPLSRQIICEDIWESVGPNAGTQPGGWVDTNCLMIDKTVCEAVLRWWSIPLRNDPRGVGADRNVFSILSREFRGRGSDSRTTYYALNEYDSDNDQRVARIGHERYRRAGLTRSDIMASPAEGLDFGE